MKQLFTGIIGLCICFLAGFSLQAQDLKQISLEDIWKDGTFAARSVYGLRSMNNGVDYTTLEGRGTQIVKHSFKDASKEEVLVDLANLEGDIPGMMDYAFSADESKILFYTGYERIYRRSFTADYYVYDLHAGTLKPLSENGKQQLATFSPDASHVAFVRKNNLFIKDLAAGKEWAITDDGRFNHIINGAPDWVYEEEFEFNQAFAWAPDGSSVAYMKFDESAVKEFNMTMFQGTYPTLKDNSLYPENRHWKYPKAGEDNSIVTVHVYHLSTGKTVKMDVGDETDQYIPRIRWTRDPAQLSIFRLNRLQNSFDLLLADVTTGQSNSLYHEENSCYIDEGNFDNLSFLKDGKHFVLTSEMNGWTHIYLYDMDGRQVRALTAGEYDVTNYLGFDEKHKIFYFQAAKVSPLQREVYSVKMNGKGFRQLSQASGTNRAVFSKGFKYYINYFSNVNTPTLVTLHEASGKQIRVLEDNAALQDKIKGYAFSPAEFFSFTTSEGIALNGYMIKPLDFDAARKYPVLMTQYSGPNSQSALDRWSVSWEHYLAQQGYIVVCVDPRGTGARGEAFRKVTYLQLGKYESTDQIEAAKYLASQSYIDASRIGIWGWSFGGFMSALCMEKGDGIFKAGIAVAPVTNWRYYDNIYTERFMRTPQENPEGYDQNSPLFFADQLQGKLLMIHGSADDNVHVQNSMEMAEKLVQANKQFDMHIYTNRNHSIYGGNTRLHLFTKMAEFLFKNL